MIEFADIIDAIRFRWKLATGVFAAIMLLCIVSTALWARHYTATSTILIDDLPADPANDTPSSTASAAGVLGTQANIISSYAVASDVVNNLQLAQNPDLITEWQKQTDGTGSINAWISKGLLSNLSVIPGKDSNILQVSYSGTSPTFAAQVANSFATTYLSTQLRLRTEPAKTYARWFETQTQDVRQKLVDAQNRFAAFQAKSGIVSATNTDTEGSKLVQLSGEMVAAQSAAADAGARAKNAAASPDVQNSAVIQSLRTQIASQAAQVNQLRITYGPNHPTLLAATAQLAGLQSKLGAETSVAARSVSVASGAAQSREGQMQGYVSAQKGKMIAQISNNSQLGLLQRDVDSARTAYDNVTQRLSAMRLRSALPQTNVSLLDSATPPLFPSSPNVPLRLLLGFSLGIMFGVAAALGAELLHPRARSVEGLIRLTGLPVVASLSMERPTVMQLLGNGGAA